MVYDVIVSGIGPSGASFLKELEETNLNILALDAAKFPRWKLCAGGLTERSLNQIKNKFQVPNSLIKSTVKSIKLFNEEKFINIDMSKSPIHTVDRTLLDFTVLSSIKAKVHQGESVLSAERKKDLIEVKTNKGIYKTRVLISADGVNSRLSRLFKVKRDIGFTYESFIQQSQTDIVIDVSDFSWGYYWIFPKGDTLATGVGKFSSKSIKEKLGRLNKKHGISGNLIFESGFPIPCGKEENDVYRNGILFLGDAGGLVNPLTGEGIYYAVKSGEIAASAVKHAFKEGNFKLLSRYKVSVDRSMGEEFKWAKRIGKLFYGLKSLSFYLSGRNRNLSELVCNVLSGNITYKRAVLDFAKGIF